MTILRDPGKLRQVLVNLLSNAIKFTDEGSISVSVSGKALIDDKYEILFTVEDTGIDIPLDNLGELFQPFSQAEMTLSRKRDGADLDLAIIKGLVELMGGKIWVEAITSDRPKSLGGDKAPLESLSEKHPLRVLVAEDNTSNQRVLLEMLKKMGYRADAVADGKEVLLALEHRPYDLILMDVKMPRMDGTNLAKEIRSYRQVLHLVLLVFSNHKRANGNFHAVLTKPVKPSQLYQVLTSSLSGKP
jgi:CheY-like chemotaxis protein